jgi:hypothetical protein
MSENELGLTMEDQASPDLSESSEQQVEFDDTPETEPQVTEQPAQTEKRQRTKDVSDRINQIRAEAQQEVDSLRQQLEEANNSLYAYQANEQGISLEEFMAQKQSEEERIREAIDNDPEVRRLRQSEFERMKSDVLSNLQTAFPKDNIEDIDNFPPDFYAMLRVGIDPVKAYRVVVSDEKKTAPPSTGSTKSEGQIDSHYYSQEQVAGMSTQEIMDHYDDIIASKEKW